MDEKWWAQGAETTQNKTGEDHKIWRGGGERGVEDDLQKRSSDFEGRSGGTRDDGVMACRRY